MSLLYEKNGRLATMTFNRPESMNAMDPTAYREARDALRDFTQDDNLSVLIFTGVGDRAFTAGGDLKGYAKKPIADWRTEFWRGTPDPLVELNAMLLNCPKPLIAAVNGYCVGWGMVVLVSCDVRIAVPEAKFGYLEVLRGLVGGGGIAERLPHQMPYAHAMRILLSGRLFDADEACRWGLINEIVEPSELMPAAERLAEEMLRVAPLELRIVKTAVRRSYDIPLQTAIGITSRESLIYRNAEDFSEGLRAWVDRRPGVWKGR